MSASPAFQTALGLAVKARREELKLTQEAVSLSAPICTSAGSQTSRMASVTPATGAPAVWLQNYRNEAGTKFRATKRLRATSFSSTGRTVTTTTKTCTPP
jgi:type IV secretory pathway TrbL component